MPFLAGGLLDKLSKIFEISEGSGDRTTDSNEFISNKVGAYTGDGGADANDSVKAEIDIVRTEIAALPTDADVTADCTSSLNTYDPPTKSEMDAGFAGIVGLSTQEKARLHLGFHDQYPLIETFAGYLDEDSNFAANNAITSQQVAEQASRYPGAVAWTFKESNAGETRLNIGSSEKRLFLAPAVDGHICAIGALWPAIITPAQAATWLPNDERLVFECLLNADSTNNNVDTANYFFGLANVGVEEDWTVINLANVAATVRRRVGFVTKNDATKNLAGMTDNGTTLTVSTAFTPGINAIHHYKLVYDIGTSVAFYVDGVLQQTINTNLPTSNLSSNSQLPLIPIFWWKMVTAGPLARVFGVRCYFQNGA